MDTELARTFLTVVETGNFINAAERLHVSQSTVSTRIHTLEEQLGCSLFVRNKAGTTLTSAGRQFQRHASTLVRTVEQARHDVGIPKGFSGTLTIGGRRGSGYFPMRIVLPHLAAKQLYIIKKAPEFFMPAYVVYPLDSERDVFASAIDIMHRIATSKTMAKNGARSTKGAIRTKR